jgi:hypothetical protein
MDQSGCRLASKQSSSGEQKATKIWLRVKLFEMGKREEKINNFINQTSSGENDNH